jgi:hypothetical protein
MVTSKPFRIWYRFTAARFGLQRQCRFGTNLWRCWSALQTGVERKR